MLKAVSNRGFSLIELLVTISLSVLLLYLAQAGFSGWVGNNKARSVAEAIQNGVRAAQAEAVKRNRQVAFVLTNAAPAANAAASAGGKNWYIQVLPIVATEVVDTPYVQGGSFGNIGVGAVVTGPAAICFNSIARMVVNTAATTTAAFGVGCTTAAATVYTVTTPTANRTYQVQVSMGGQVRLCDASRVLSAANPDGC